MCPPDLNLPDEHDVIDGMGMSRPKRPDSGKFSCIWFTYFNFILFHVLMHVIIRQPGNTIIAFKGWLSSAFLSR